MISRFLILLGRDYPVSCPIPVPSFLSRADAARSNGRRATESGARGEFGVCFRAASNFAFGRIPTVTFRRDVGPDSARKPALIRERSFHLGKDTVRQFLI
jgi:hypothetical protein